MCTCDFSKLLNNLLLCFAFGNRADEQPVVGDRDTHPDVLVGPNLVIIALRERKPHVKDKEIPPTFVVLERKKRVRLESPTPPGPTSFTASWAASLVQKVTKA